MPTPQSPGPSRLDAPGQLVLRAPLPTDEAQVLAAQSELADDGFDFALSDLDGTWKQYLDKVERDRSGVGLSAGRVPATMLFATVGHQIVGRVHIRHELTPALLEVGGHIGYCVRPAHRRRGYATEMLRQGLEVVSGLGIEHALVTCGDDNPGSIATIERCGGVLDNVGAGAGRKRRYWIGLA